MRGLALGFALAGALALAGCPQSQPPTPGEVAAQMRGSAPSFDALHAAAAKGHDDVLEVRETMLGHVALGEAPARVKERLGEPNRRFKRPEGEWWEYEEVVKSAAQQDPGEDGKPPRDIVSTLAVLFKDVPPHIAPAGDPVASGAAVTPAPETATQAVAQIRAWAPGDAETRSMVRLYDPAARVERKYPKPADKLWVGLTGGEVWVYPAANVAFVMSPPLPTDDEDGAAKCAPSRFVAGTIVGL